MSDKKGQLLEEERDANWNSNWRKLKDKSPGIFKQRTRVLRGRKVGYFNLHFSAIPYTGYYKKMKKKKKTGEREKIKVKIPLYIHDRADALCNELKKSSGVVRSC